VSGARGFRASVFTLLALGCTGFGACVLLAPFPDVAPDPGGNVGGSLPGDGCEPGSTRRCYSGPPGTEGAGVCTAGIATCNDEGTAYGPCSGEVVPAYESCATDDDENCDGRGCLGVPRQSVALGGAGEQRGSAIAAGPGAVVMTGSVSGALELGAEASDELGRAGDLDCFLASFNGAGQLQWGRRFADAAGRGVAVATGGDVVLVGGAAGDVDFGGGPLTGNGNGNGNGEDVFVARFDAAGSHLWSRRFGDGANQYATAVAVDAAGSSIITGGFWGKLDFDKSGEENENTKIESSGESDIFLAKLDAQGTVVWAVSFGEEEHHQVGTGVAVDGQGNIILVGWFGGAVSFGGQSLRSEGETDLFVVKLSPAGDHLWSRSAHATNAARALGVAVDSAGNILATGSFRSSIRIGDETHESGGDKDVVVLKLDDNGVPLWSRSYGDDADQEGVGVAVDPAGDVVVTGFFLGHIDLGAGPLAATGAADGFLAKLYPDGTPLWSRSFGDAEEQGGTAVATDLDGDTWATGYFSGGADFDGSALTSRGASDAFLVQLGP
jgi:hypothetical protein